MSDPPDSYLGDVLHALNMFRGVSDLIDHLRIHPVEESSEQRLTGIPSDFEDDQGNQKANERVGQGETEPHA